VVTSVAHLIEGAAEKDAQVRVAVHDASRLEWSVALPAEDRATSYAIDFELEIPSHLFAQHAPWERLQQFARLDHAELPPDASTIDGLRRSVVALAARLTRTSEGFARHCLVATAPDADESVASGLLMWLESAVRIAHDARARLTAPAENEAHELMCERALVDEYLSTRMLEFFAGAERALESAADDAPILDAAVVEDRIADALAEEIAHRREKGFVDASSGSPAALELYIERASLLKKHFQEVLFLDATRFAVADRIHHVVAAVVAIIASTWAFLWQIMLAHRSAGATAFSGVIAFALIAGAVYAAKDRIKEVGRAWVAGKVHKHYAQRVVRFQLPAGRDASQRTLVRARESFHQTEIERPDPLNPESPARVRSTVVQYTQRGRIERAKRLAEAGTRIKQVFRYDLSPLFARLDDATKQVPIYDEHAKKVRFADAARCYRLPIRVVVTRGGATEEQHGVLVVHKRGLARVERSV